LGVALTWPEKQCVGAHPCSCGDPQRLNRLAVNTEIACTAEHNNPTACISNFAGPASAEACKSVEEGHWAESEKNLSIRLPLVGAGHANSREEIAAGSILGSPSGRIAVSDESRWTGECRKPCQPSRLDSSNSGYHQRITCLERKAMFTFMLFMVLLLACLVGSLIGWGWLISIASREGGTLIAIGCFLVPPLVFLYALTNYQAAKTPFWLLIGSVSILGTLSLLV